MLKMGIWAESAKYGGGKIEEMCLGVSITTITRSEVS